MNTNDRFQQVFQDGLLMQVNVSFWSGAKILRPEDLGLKEDDVAEAYKLGRKMLIPHEVVHGFRHLEGQARNLVAKNSFPFPMGNARFVPRKVFTDVNLQLRAIKSAYMELAEDLIARYEEYRAQMRPVYQQAAETAFEKANPATMEFGADVNIDEKMAKREQDKAVFVEEFLNRIDSYYPTANSLRGRFSLDWSIYEIAAPSMNLTDGESIEQREEANREIRRQMNEKIGGFVEDVVKVLRQETVDVCSRIATSIKEGKVIRSTTIDSLRNFIDRFKNMNFVGDKTIEAQLEAVRSEFLGHDPKTIAEDLDLQTELGAKLTQIAEQAGKIANQDINGVTSQYVRAVNWVE